MIDTRVSFLMILLISLIILLIGVIILQVFLSKRENKWAGLILPFSSFGVSLLVLFGVLMYFPATMTESLFVNGELIERTTSQIIPTTTIVGTAAFMFIIFNIPTAIYLAIYAICRDKHSKRRSLEKMRIQDLE